MELIATVIAAVLVGLDVGLAWRRVQARQQHKRTADRGTNPDVIRLVDLIEDNDQPAMLQGRTFVGVRVLGPAVLLPVGDVTVIGCTSYGSVEQISSWRTLASAASVIGGIGLDDVHFVNCEFEHVGWACREDAEPFTFEGCA